MVEISVIKFRFALGIVLAFGMAIAGLSLPIIFAAVGLFEILILGLLLLKVQRNDNISMRSFWGYVLHQFASSEEINFIEVTNSVGTRVLACLLGYYGFLYYVPAVLLYIYTCTFVEVTKKGEQ